MRCRHWRRAIAAVLGASRGPGSLSFIRCEEIMNARDITFHYVFVHRTLRSVAYRSPAGTMFSLMSPSRAAFLSALAQDTASLLDQKDSDFDIGGIQIHGVRIAGRPTVIVQMPRPTRCPEAHFAAIVLQKIVTGPIRKSDLTGAGVEFFTLEESRTHAEAPETMLCSWEADGSHHNFGAGPKPTLEAFRERLKQLYENC